MVEFREMLAELRQDRRMTQRDLASAIHISNSSVSAYERGDRIPAIDILIQLADYFDVTADYLLGRTDQNLSLTHLSKQYTENITLEELLILLLKLSPVQRQGLSVIVKDMCFAQEIRQKRSLGE